MSAASLKFKPVMVMSLMGFAFVAFMFINVSSVTTTNVVSGDGGEDEEEEVPLGHK